MSRRWQFLPLNKSSREGISVTASNRRSFIISADIGDALEDQSKSILDEAASRLVASWPRPFVDGGLVHAM
jgi:hypothetical protein